MIEYLPTAKAIRRRGKSWLVVVPD